MFLAVFVLCWSTVYWCAHLFPRTYTNWSSPQCEIRSVICNLCLQSTTSVEVFVILFLKHFFFFFWRRLTQGIKPVTFLPAESHVCPASRRILLSLTWLRFWWRSWWRKHWRPSRSAAAWTSPSCRETQQSVTHCYIRAVTTSLPAARVLSKHDLATARLHNCAFLNHRQEKNCIDAQCFSFPWEISNNSFLQQKGWTQ